MEPRAAIGEFDRATGDYTLWTTSQNPHVIRLLMGAFVLGIPEHKLRVIAPDVGGGFGSKIYHYAEEAIVTWASKKIGRPVKWVAERSESFMSDAHGRDHVTHAELALDADGKFLGLRVQTLANMGAYLSTFAPSIPTYLYATLLAGQYTTPAIYAEVKAVFTHTVPVDAYRGAGRPEACYLIERIVENAARELGIDKTELRRRNFIPPTAMPYQTPVALQYDCGDSRRTWIRGAGPDRLSGLPRPQGGSEGTRQAARHRPRQLHRSLRYRPQQRGRCTGRPRRALRIGLNPLPPDRFGDRVHRLPQPRPEPRDDVRPACLRPLRHSDRECRDRPRRHLQGTVRHGDLRVAQPRGGRLGHRQGDGQGGQQGKRIAAHMLEAAETDIVFEQGRFTVAGTDRSLDDRRRALSAYVPHNFPLDELEPGLDEQAFYDPKNFTYPNGTQIAEVEIDPETGVVRIEKFVAVDDFGRVINPMVVEGQVHGGIVQGIGQALMEQCVYDPETGQLLTGSYMDYCMPRADDVPSFTVRTTRKRPARITRWASRAAARRVRSAAAPLS